MTGLSRKLDRLASLRSRAVAYLNGPSSQPLLRADATAALGVLYELASSPATAPRALTLLHELQVHQVEVEMQDEELRRSRLDLESTLARQLQLYDHAPVGYCTIGSNAELREINLAGASLLGFDRDSLRGRMLDEFLTLESVRSLHSMLRQLPQDGATGSTDLDLRGAAGDSRRVHASARQDPAGEGFLIALIALAGKTIP